MKFDLKTQQTEAINYFNKLLENECRCEIKEVKKKRSVSQNAYLHVCISLFAVSTGYTLEEAKTLLKRNCPFMVYEKNNVKFLKNTSTMNSKELTDFIEYIRNFSARQNIFIPSSEDYLLHQFEIDKEIESQKTYT